MHAVAGAGPLDVRACAHLRFVTEVSMSRPTQTHKHSRAPIRVAVLALALLGCNRAMDRVLETNVDSVQKALAQETGMKLHERCKSGKFEPLGDEATPAMREGLTPDKQKAACESMRAMFGDFQSLTYAETWRVQGLNVYRFKGKFSKTSDTPEIRVVLDAQSKLSGLWVKPWNDTL